MGAQRAYELQVALTAALKADAAVAALVSARIYDDPPQTVSFPFIQVSQDVGEPFDGTGLDGWEQIMRLDIWSRTGGRSVEATEIAAATYALLHNRTFLLTQGSNINGRMIPGGQQVLRDKDTQTVHVPQRFRYVTQD